MKQMTKQNFTEGDYIKREDVLNILRFTNWDMPRPTLISHIENLEGITLSHENRNAVILSKIKEGNDLED